MRPQEKAKQSAKKAATQSIPTDKKSSDTAAAQKPEQLDVRSSFSIFLADYKAANSK